MRGLVLVCVSAKGMEEIYLSLSLSIGHLVLSPVRQMMKMRIGLRCWSWSSHDYSQHDVPLWKLLMGGDAARYGRRMKVCGWARR